MKHGRIAEGEAGLQTAAGVRCKEIEESNSVIVSMMMTSFSSGFN
jgi:hypothetical protein